MRLYRVNKYLINSEKIMWMLGWGTLSFPQSGYCIEYTPWGSGGRWLKMVCKCYKNIMTKLLTTWSYNSRRGNGILISWLYWGGWADMVTQHPPVRKSWCRSRRMFLVVCLHWLDCLGQHKYCKFSHIWWIWCGANCFAGGILCGGAYYCLFQR